MKSFLLLLKKPAGAGKDVFYNMHMEEKIDDDIVSHSVYYSYGVAGSKGKSNIKKFDEFTCYGKAETPLEMAENFVKAKFDELIEKGYVEAGQEDVCGIKLQPGEYVYLEWKDKYNGDKSFYDVEMSPCGFLIMERIGDFHGKAVENEFHLEDLSPDYLDEKFEDYLSRGYKRKPTRPKSLPTKFVNSWGNVDSSSGDEDDEDKEIVSKKRKELLSPSVIKEEKQIQEDCEITPLDSQQHDEKKARVMLKEELAE